MLGHSKTVLVLLIGWAYLGDVMTSRKVLGMVLAIVGMVLYGWLQSGPPSPSPGAVATAKKVASSDTSSSDKERRSLVEAGDVETGNRKQHQGGDGA